jgi:hypothetical protein
MAEHRDRDRPQAPTRELARERFTTRPGERVLDLEFAADLEEKSPAAPHKPREPKRPSEGE